ncbi:hypothetical protein [Streptomyces griseus]|uniref:hypothetical protein n=1 Tax=Streptomyces griseus TaxID=1911 RepID=UPI000560F521|nr:hypothetical protein [Streptomyces griseus]
MSSPDSLSALTAGVSTGLVLLLRWAATRNTGAPRRQDEQESAAAVPMEPVLRQAEDHVRCYWARVRPLYPTPRD